MATVKGDANPNSLVGTASSDDILGYEGDDSLYGLGGDDTLFGGEDNDSLYGGDDKDTLYGGIGADTLSGDGDGDILYGEDGNDVFLQSSDGDHNEIYGGTGDDEVDLSGSTAGWTVDLQAGTGSSGATSIELNSIETITGSAYADTIYGGSDTDVVYGGDGGDFIGTSGGGASLYGGIGNDTLQASGTTAQDLLFGSTGNNTYLFDDASGVYSNDFIFGGGTDTLLLRAQSNGDVFDLNGVEIGNVDAITFDSVGTNMDVTVELDPDEFTVTGIEFATDLIVTGNDATGSTETIRVDLNDSGSATELDFSAWTFVDWGGQGETVEIIGSGRDETITGTSMDDSIGSGLGDDSVGYTGGSDVLDGGGGTADEVDFSAATSGIDVDLTTGAGSSGSETLTVTGFETVTATSLSDTIYGGSDTDVVYGGDGGDFIGTTGGGASLYGGIGNDTLQASGTTAQDLLFGSTGNNTYLFDDASGVYSNDFIFGGGTDTLLLRAQSNGDVFDLNGVEIGNVDAITFDSVGTNMDVTVELDPDEFTVTGIEFATDLIVTGNDAAGSTETIRVDLNDSGSATELDFSAWTFVDWGGQGETVEIIGSARDETITGTSMDDSTSSGLGSDIIYGGGGADTLVSGGGGTTSLYGGLGNDTLQASGTTAGDLLFGGLGNNTYLFDDASGTFVNDFIFGGGDDTLLFQAQSNGDVFDLNSVEIGNVDAITFDSVGTNMDVTVELDPDEFTVTGIEFANDLIVTGNDAAGSTETIRVDLNDSGSQTELDFSAWTFVDWGGQGETVEIIGSARDETITGTTENDVIDGGAGADTVFGGAGADVFRVTGAGDDFSGDGISGGGGTDTLLISAAGNNDNFDLSGTDFASIETLRFQKGSTNLDVSVELDPDEIGSGLASALLIVGNDNAGSTETIRIDLNDSATLTTLDLSAWTFSDWGGQGETVEIIGSLRAETVTGTSMDDVIYGGQGADTLYGGEGGDFLGSSGGASWLYGGDGDDTLRASGAADQDILLGQDDDDVFLVDDAGGNYDLDLFIGGNGSDTVLLEGQSNGDSFDLTGQDVAGIEALSFASVGTNMDVTVELNPDEFASSGAEYANNLMVTGNDAAGSTEVIRVDLNDSNTETVLDFSGWTFSDWGGQGEYVEVIGSARDETITGTSQVDILDGGAGEDTVFGGAGDDVLRLSSSASGDIEELDGGADTDTVDMSGFTSAVWVNLGYGGNEVWTKDGDDLVSGTWREIADLTSVENVIATDYDDFVKGTGAANTVTAGAGDDVIELASFNAGTLDSVDGGAGTDTTDFSGFGSAVWVDLAYSGNEVWTKDSDNLNTGTWREIADLSNVESVVGTNGLDQLLGDDGDNGFGYVGTSATPGVDLFDGRDGSDTVDFSRFGSAVWVDLDSAGLEGWTKDATDFNSGTWRVIADIDNVENIVGTDGVDQMWGNADDNSFFYRGTAANTGTELIDGRGGTDTADFSGFDSAVWVKLEHTGPEAWTRDTGDVDTGTWRIIADLDNIENLAGTEHDDFLQGDAGANTISGAAGDDVLSLKSADAGAIDLLDGETGSDTADFSEFGSAVWVDLSYAGNEVWTKDGANLTTGTWREIADLASVENITGSAYDDDLAGDANANTITGGAGNDDLSGGGGFDRFIFAGDFGNDVLADFDANDAEQIDLSGAAGIDDFADLVANHLVDNGGTAQIVDDNGNTIDLTGWTVADIGTGQAIDTADFVFIA